MALAAALVSAADLLHPSTVAVGGFAQAVPGFTDQAAAQLSLLARPGALLPPVVPAALGALSSLHGAVALARTTATPAPDTAAAPPLAAPEATAKIPRSGPPCWRQPPTSPHPSTSIRYAVHVSGQVTQDVRPEYRGDHQQTPTARLRSSGDRAPLS
ncbi:hypothetical protein GCM10023257_35550 [Streptomyces hyderabadensis]|uniref:Uncharacterized protein n=1 Tax=Streptomyces hyderabadensis TaxID=598549 RepID=A0ABP9I8R6_9ACTN